MKIQLLVLGFASCFLAACATVNSAVDEDSMAAPQVEGPFPQVRYYVINDT